MASPHGSMAIPFNGRGGKLPEYQGGGGVHTPGTQNGRLSGQAAEISGQAFRAQNAAEATTWEALARAAGNIDGAVQKGLKAVEDYNAARAQNAYNQYELEGLKLKAELEGLRGENALGEEGVLARLKKWRARASRTLTEKLGPMARDLFARNAGNLDARLEAWGIQKEARENVVFQNSVSEGAIGNAVLYAQENPGSDEALCEALGRIAAEYQRIGEREGKDAGWVRARFNEAAQKLCASSVDALIEMGDLAGATRLLGRADIRGLDAGHEQTARREAKANGLDEELLLAILMQESGGNPAAVSGAGAMGLMQLMPETAKSLGVDAKDAEQNIRGGAKYFGQMLKKYGGDVQLALTAYNWGPGNVDAWRKTGRGVNGQAMPREAREYASRVLGRMGGGAGLIDPATRGRLERKIQAAVAREEAEARREAAELRAGLQQEIREYMAAAQEGRASEMSISTTRVLEAFGEDAPKVQEELDQAARLSDAVARLYYMDNQAIASALADLGPDRVGPGFAMKRASQEQFRRIAQDHLQRREKDPTAYLMLANPDLQEAYTAMFREPGRERTAAYLEKLAACSEVLKLGEAPIFPNGQAQAISRTIMAAENPGVALQSWASMFGSSWPRALRELSAKDCLPMEAKLAANGMDPMAAKKLLLAARTPDFMSKNYDLHAGEFTRRDFELAVRDEMAEFNATLLMGGDSEMAWDINRSVALLAMQYVNSGIGWDAAIKRAGQDVVLGKYEFKRVNGMGFRVPKTLDGDKIELAAGYALKQIAYGDLKGMYEERKELGPGVEEGLDRDALIRGSYWVTNEDESGLILFLGPNFVLDKDDKRIEFSWAELARYYEGFSKEADKAWEITQKALNEIELGE